MSPAPSSEVLKHNSVPTGKAIRKQQIKVGRKRSFCFPKAIINPNKTLRNKSILNKQISEKEYSMKAIYIS